MGTTPNYMWPYPEPGADVDVARDIKALALAIDPTVKTVATPPWAMFRNTAGAALATGVLGYASWALIAQSGAPFQVRTASTNYLDCLVAGTYQYFGTMGWTFAASRTTGTVSSYVHSPDGTILVAHDLPQGGAINGGNVLHGIKTFAVGNEFVIKMQNNSGGNATPSVNSYAAYICLIRIGP